MNANPKKRASKDSVVPRFINDKTPSAQGAISAAPKCQDCGAVLEWDGDEWGCKCGACSGPCCNLEIGKIIDAWDRKHPEVA
jgi:hypothetical protein